MGDVVSLDSRRPQTHKVSAAVVLNAIFKCEGTGEIIKAQRLNHYLQAWDTQRSDYIDLPKDLAEYCQELLRENSRPETPETHS